MALKEWDGRRHLKASYPNIAFECPACARLLVAQQVVVGADGTSRCPLCEGALVMVCPLPEGGSMLVDCRACGFRNPRSNLYCGSCSLRLPTTSGP